MTHPTFGWQIGNSDQVLIEFCLGNLTVTVLAERTNGNGKTKSNGFDVLQSDAYTRISLTPGTVAGFPILFS